MLLDVNNSAQILPDKRIDLSLDAPSDPEALCLDIDRRPTTPTQGRKSYRKLLAEVPHSPFASARERFPDLMADLDAGRDSPADPNQGMPHPPTFLTADDIDNYIFEVDLRHAKKRAVAIANKDPSSVPDLKDLLLPTLAPIAVAARDNDYNIPSSMNIAPREVAVRNPTSVYNWLRKNAPKTFLQDGEAHADTAATEDAGHGQDSHAKSGASGRGGGRGSRGGGVDRGERGRGSIRGKKTGGGRARAKEPVDDAMDLDDDGAFGVSTPTESKKGGAKRKRVVDDDPGYRPKGGSSRPAKKKKKSLGAEADLTATPTASGPKKPKKAAAALEKGHDPEVDDDDDEEHDAITARTGDD